MFLLDSSKKSLTPDLKKIFKKKIKIYLSKFFSKIQSKFFPDFYFGSYSLLKWNCERKFFNEKQHFYSSWFAKKKIHLAKIYEPRIRSLITIIFTCMALSVQKNTRFFRNSKMFLKGFDLTLALVFLNSVMRSIELC